MRLNPSILGRVTLTALLVGSLAGPVPQNEREPEEPQPEWHHTPNRLTRRASPAAGVGVELECRSLEFRNEEQLDHADSDVLDKIKGSPLLLQDKPEASEKLKQNEKYWALTAELADGLGVKRLHPEIIVDGKEMKVGASNPSLKEVGKSITDFLAAWKPKKDDAVKVKNFDDKEVWKITSSPSSEEPKACLWGLQVTSPMSLDKIQTCFVDEDGRDPNCPIMALAFSKLNKLKIVVATDFDLTRFPKIKKEDLTDEFLGFFSLIVSYAIQAKRGYQIDLGPKQSLPIMPRTDITTIYKNFAKEKLKAQLGEGKCGLRDIVDSVAREKVSDATFKWEVGESSDSESDRKRKRDSQNDALAPSQPRLSKRMARSKLHVGNKWDSRDADVKAGTLEVGTWLDEMEDENEVLAAMDEIVFDGQIGGFGDAMETISGSSKAYPIFEFRDIAAVNGAQIEKKFEDIDKYLKDLKAPARKKARAIPRSIPVTAGMKIFKRDDADLKTCDCVGKKKKTCDNKKCPPLTIKKAGQCIPCGPDEKPNAKQDKCEKKTADGDCSEGQAKDPITDTCRVECKDGEVSNVKGDKCAKDCPQGEKKNANGDRCVVDCPKEQISNSLGDKCATDCPEGEKKNPSGDRCDVECKNGEVPNATNNKCAKDCPTGQKKTAAGDHCEVDCKNGEIPTLASDKCVKECPPPTKKNAKGDKCESPDSDSDDGEKCELPKVKINGKCDLCKPTEKPNAKGDGCEEDKDKTDKRRRRMSFCMTVVALSGADMGLDYTLDGVQDAMGEAVNKWPEGDDLPEPGDIEFGNQNIELPDGLADGTWAERDEQRADWADSHAVDFINWILDVEDQFMAAGDESDGAKLKPKKMRRSPKTTAIARRDHVIEQRSGRLQKRFLFALGRVVARFVTNIFTRGARGARAGATRAGQTVGEGIDKIVKNPAFRDCLKGVAMGLALAQLHVDLNIPAAGYKKGVEGKPRTTVRLNKDGGDDTSKPHIVYTIFKDEFWHKTRLEADTCMNLPPDFDNTVGGVDVDNGKCTFYGDLDCKDPDKLFDLTNDYNHDLSGDQSDNISSLMCRECDGDEECKDESEGTDLWESDDPSSENYGDIQKMQQEEDLTG